MYVLNHFQFDQITAIIIIITITIIIIIIYRFPSLIPKISLARQIFF